MVRLGTITNPGCYKFCYEAKYLLCKRGNELIFECRINDDGTYSDFCYLTAYMIGPKERINFSLN